MQSFDLTERIVVGAITGIGSAGCAMICQIPLLQIVGIGFVAFAIGALLDLILVLIVGLLP